VISKKWGGITIRDLESKNGTFKNNRRIAEDYLHDGDRIALGTIVMQFRNPQEINIARLPESTQPKFQPTQIDPNTIPLITEEKKIEEGLIVEKEREKSGGMISSPKRKGL
jgi:pSer/pThr/pTyr-binding forkhead associated (FHA) protein